MVDSNTVLFGQTLIYTFYALAIILLMGWFGYRVTTDGPSKVKPAFFYTFVGFLILLGVTIHMITLHTIPWKPMDMDRANIKADKVFNISVQDHKFQLPAEKMMVKTNDKVLFNVTSGDLTYGFGLFRNDNTMVFQMQVLPGHNNDILWQFDRPGVYSIRSTEYSGPAGVFMVEKDVVEVTD